jgi:hypothetical protein
MEKHIHVVRADEDLTQEFLDLTSEIEHAWTHLVELLTQPSDPLLLVLHARSVALCASELERLLTLMAQAAHVDTAAWRLPATLKELREGPADAPIIIPRDPNLN